jgi:acetoin utilization deacetylase AcuC-like enzyme
MSRRAVPAFFHPDQLLHAPKLEWHNGASGPYPETPARAERILHALQSEPSCSVRTAVTPAPTALLQRVIDPRLLALYEVAASLPPGEEHHPTVFAKRPPPVTTGTPRLVELGAYASDTYAPLTPSTHRAVLAGAGTTYAAARALSESCKVSYALCRPPGHHASLRRFGGYCYLNQAALAAHELGRRGPVAILDIDLHHGDGTQELFWRSSRFLFVDVHRDTTEVYPYFSGAASETGAGAGLGFTVNLPLPGGTNGSHYQHVIENDVLPRVHDFKPTALVLSAGFDTYHRDPLGDFALTTEDYFGIGRRIGSLGIPTCVVQEGGYCVEDLGHNVVALLRGLLEGQALGTQGPHGSSRVVGR